MIKILKVYENITDFNNFKDNGNIVKVVYKDTEKPDDYFKIFADFSMSPGDSPSPPKYYSLMGIKFHSLQHAIDEDYSGSNHSFSVNAEDGLRFEILEFVKD